ncbi:hypothetical protein ACH4PW_35035 [Streptomyces sp. NPDC017082]
MDQSELSFSTNVDASGLLLNQGDKSRSSLHHTRRRQLRPPHTMLSS